MRGGARTQVRVRVPLTVLSMSVHDHPSLRKYWWRQVIPSFFAHHMDMLNITLKQSYEDDTQCRPRYFAMINNKQWGHTLFLEGGMGMVQHIYEEERIDVICYYKTNFGTHMFPRDEKDVEGVISMTIYCPLWKSVPQHEKLCDHLQSRNVSSKLILLSTESSEKLWPYPQKNCDLVGPHVYNYSMKLPTVPFDELEKSAAETMTNVVRSVKGMLHISTLFSSNTIPPPPSLHQLTVCTVQTYMSPQSGPMLWLFANYYSLLGFQVVIYDRYGRHESYMSELIDQRKVQYHPYTAFELARPDMYNSERVNQEES